MRQKKLAISLLLLLILGITSCSKDDNEKPALESPIGKTFESLILSITFESADSVSFHSKTTPSYKGKAKYLFNDGTITILNPHGKRLPVEEVTEAYFLVFKGKMASSEVIDNIEYVYKPPRKGAALLPKFDSISKKREKEVRKDSQASLYNNIEVPASRRF